MPSHSKHKNKGKHRRVQKVRRVKGNKFARRVSAHVAKIGGGRIGQKILLYQIDKAEHHENELVTNGHERERVTEKLVEQRAEERNVAIVVEPQPAKVPETAPWNKRDDDTTP